MSNGLRRLAGVLERRRTKILPPSGGSNLNLRRGVTTAPFSFSCSSPPASKIEYRQENYFTTAR